MSDAVHTDEELVRLSLTDTRYFAVLIDRYEQPLRRYISRLGQLTREDIEDVLQDIFLKVYKNLNACDVSLKFSSWIYRIAHNEVVSFFRHKTVAAHGHTMDIPEEVFHNLMTDTSIVEEIDVRDVHLLLRRALGMLPYMYREILILKYFEYKSYNEISDILRIPLGTIAVRISRAKQKLAHVMKQIGYQDK